MLQENDLFWYGCGSVYFEALQNGKGAILEELEWVPICIPKNDFCLGLDDGRTMDFLEGYIHKSRLRPLERLEEYQGDDFSFQYQLSEFDPTNRVIETFDDNWISDIDGRRAWGRDGDMPRVQVDAVQVELAGQSIPVHRVFFGDVFECTNDFTVYKNVDTYFVYQFNSDGAGGYELVWVFDSQGLRQRFVGSIY